jgi:hypothetical protein
MADKAYSSAANRAYLRRRGIQAVIPVKVASIRIWLRDPAGWPGLRPA